MIIYLIHCDSKIISPYWVGNLSPETERKRLLIIFILFYLSQKLSELSTRLYRLLKSHKIKLFQPSTLHIQGYLWH